MNDTNVLIEQLAARAMPVRRLPSPMRRTLHWIALAVAIIAVAVVIHGGLRPGLLQHSAIPNIWIEWVASVLTGVFAAYSVFQISVPGRSLSWAWLPLPAALLWLSGIGLGCLGDVSQLGASAFAFHLDGMECARAIALTSLPLGLTLLLMVRYASVVRPVPTAMLTALSATALSAAGVSLIHDGESALMVLLWHLGTVAILSLLSWLFNRQLFSWVGYSQR